MTIKIGWIGCGRHATWMLMPQLARSGFEIAAVCDRDAERLAPDDAGAGRLAELTRAGRVIAWVTTGPPDRARLAALEAAGVTVDILPTAAP